MQALKVLSKSCNFRDVTAKEYRDEAIHDAFVSGLLDSNIQKRLLKLQTLELQAAFNKARALDLTQRNSGYYTDTSTVSFNSNSAAVAQVKNERSSSDSNEKSVSAAVPKRNTKCFFLRYSYHTHTNCPAKESVCCNCEKIGHFSRMCGLNNKKILPSTSAALSLSVPKLASVQTSYNANSLAKSCIKIQLNGYGALALVDFGSTDSFVHPDLVEKSGMTVLSCREIVSLAAVSQQAKIRGHFFATITVEDECYSDVKLYVLPYLCANVILSQDWQSPRESVT